MSNRTTSAQPLQLWAGVEATVNRVGNRYFDQLERSGHAARLNDLDLIAALGIRTVRYPILWERTAPGDPDTADWSWADERLGRLREFGIEPIVGLVHHGSGPADTSLIEADFPIRLAEYAQAVAERYPWLRLFTPINEPLTTARFSGLYGHWYPHGRDDATFLRALVTQCRAVGLAMRAIRTRIPEAQLIQTEDLGRTTSTPLLSYQATFENERRWLSFDLLEGRVGPDHALRAYMQDNRVTDDDLSWFREHPCPPDIIGINFYLTSERFLDERVEQYPAWSHGGNGRHQYADVHAVIARDAAPINYDSLLREVWDRYQRPMAITEAHIGGGRESQLRWMMEIWETALQLRRAGIDLRAVTAWSVFGAYDWNKLVTVDEGFYESGAYDARSAPPRPTAVARLISDLIEGTRPSHPALVGQSFWRMSSRTMYPVAPVSSTDRPIGPPVLIVGAPGTLGRGFEVACRQRGLAHEVIGRRDFDIANASKVQETLDRVRPWAVINAAGYDHIDDAEHEPSACFHMNTTGAVVLASACADRGLPFLTFSSDHVFDGNKQHPYVEHDVVSPLGVYGYSKAEAERTVLLAHPGSLVIRTSAFFSPWDHRNFVMGVLRDLTDGKLVIAADDVIISPTYAPDLVETALDLLIDGEHGRWHLANRGSVSWAGLARQAAGLASLPERLIEGRPTADLGLTAPRPLYSVLGSERGELLPALDDALSRYVIGAGTGWQT